MNDFLKSLKPLIKGKRGGIIILLLAVGMALLIISTTIPASEKSSEKVALSEYKAQMEEEFAEFCGRVEGAGRCRVMISFSDGESYEYKGGELISSKPPRVLGVTVLCSGADSDRVRAQITELASALFDIGSNRICVLKLS